MTAVPRGGAGILPPPDLDAFQLIVSNLRPGRRISYGLEIASTVQFIYSLSSYV